MARKGGPAKDNQLGSGLALGTGKPRHESSDDCIETFATLGEAREKFGENYRGYVFTLSRPQAGALLKGKVVAFDIADREYAGFLTVE